jgi:hypothetical protein
MARASRTTVPHPAPAAHHSSHRRIAAGRSASHRLPAFNAPAPRRARPPQHPRIQVGRSKDPGRVFVDSQGSARQPPTDARHPRPRPGGGRPDSRGRWRRVPPRKVVSRAARIDASRGTQVFSEVEQHIDHARAHVSRGRERSGVVPVANDLPLAAEGAVDGEGQADGEPVDAAASAAGLVPFDDEVPVVLLDREVNDPEAIERGPRDGAPDRCEHARRAERRQPGLCSDGDLHGVTRVDSGSGHVGHRRSAARLSARPLASPAPGSGCRER